MTKVTERARFGGRKLAALLAVVATSSALPLHAATWTCYPEITNGMTGPEQITNALTQLASGGVDVTRAFTPEDVEELGGRAAVPVRGLGHQ